MINYSHAKFCVGLVIIYFCTEANGHNSPPVVEISAGKIQGKILKSRNGANYNAFMGIPYGKANRFEVLICNIPVNKCVILSYKKRTA